MNTRIVQFLASVATITLIVVATRWLANAKGARLPKVSGDSRIYEIKAELRTVCYVAALFFVVIGLAGIRNEPDQFVLGVVFISAAMFSLWFGTGTVQTSDAGICKKSVGRSQSLRWADIAKVRVHSRDGGAIELSTHSSERIVVDSRFAAREFLLDELGNRLQPFGIQPENCR